MKRKIIALFLLVFSVSSFAQTKLDTLVFNKINEYRISKNLKSLTWDTVAYKACELHTKYLVAKEFYSPKRFLSTKSDTLKSTVPYPHREEDNRFSTLGKRYDYFGGKCVNAGEVIGGNMTCAKVGDPSMEDKLATEIVKGWKNSPLHNKILIDPVYTKCGGSTSVESIEQGIKGRKCYFATSTFMLVN